MSVRVALAAMALSLWTHAAALAQTFAYPAIVAQGTALDAFVPKGWSVAMRAAGDLNKDGLDDVAAVLQSGQPAIHTRGCGASVYNSEAAPRLLVILFGKPGGGFSLAIQENHLPARADEGGMMGDPLADLRMERGTLVLSHQGGSAWRWAHIFRFRYQDGGWFLIGFTDDSYHAGSKYRRAYDYNPLTAKIEVTSIGMEDKAGCRSCFEGEACPKSKACEPGEMKMPRATILVTVPKRPLIALPDAFCAQDLGRVLPVRGER